jgi:hypothetical protein
MAYPTTEPTYTRKTMAIRWRSRAGRVHTRRVDLGHVRDGSDHYDALAVLNIGGRGDVVSYTVEAA